MNRLFKFCITVVLLNAVILLPSCNNSNESSIKIEDILKDGLIKLTDNIGDWDEGIVYDNDGFIVVKNPDANEKNLYVQIMNESDDLECVILSNPTTFIPTSLIFENNIYNFDNVGDSIIVLSKHSDKGIEYIDSINVQIESIANRTSNTATTITFLNRDDKVHKVIKALDAILGAGEGYSSSQLKVLKKNLDKISPFYYYENIESIIDELDLCRTENTATNDIIYCFTQYAKKVKIIIYDPIKYGISVRTERTATDVYGTTAIVGGGIYCASDHYKDKGEWGIILSKNPTNLSLDNYEIKELANTKNFRIELFDLEPNTTYYFKTFYKYINPKDHGDLFFSYGPKDADSYVDDDFFRGEFTTGNPQVKVLKLYNHSQPWYDNNYEGGVLYPTFNLNWDGIKYIYGIKYIFKSDPEFYYGDNDHYIYKEKQLLSDWNYIMYEKWTFNVRTNGSNAVKFRIYIDSKLNYIETNWTEFDYDWINGVTAK